MTLLGRVQIDLALLDIEAAIENLRPSGPVAVVGFCFGGLMAWLSACRLKPDCAIGFYAGRIDQFKDEQPSCPVMLHFGQRDSHIPQSVVDAVQMAHKQMPVYLYDADHGFFCDQRPSFDAAASEQAWQRSLEFLAAHLAL
jgi:carboxymethylenebutenolidase